MRILRALFPLSLGLAAACGASTSTEPRAAEPSTTSWPAMSREQKVNYMKEVVRPQMASLFQRHDAEEFSSFDCATCHGKGAKDGSFKMPNPELPALDASDGFADEKEEHPRTVEFMMKEVTPAMAKLLGQKPYDPGTQQGFGCFGCHTMKK